MNEFKKSVEGIASGKKYKKNISTFREVRALNLLLDEFVA